MVLGQTGQFLSQLVSFAWAQVDLGALPEH